MITNLPDAPSTVEPPQFAGPDHPMRKVTRQVAFDGLWDRDRRAKVQALFDGMAADWTADHDSPLRRAALLDAMERGELGDPERILELGSGTGLGTQPLSERFPGRVLAVDVAFDMLRNAPPEYAPRVQADAAALPLPNRSIDAVVLVNALLFPGEVERILRPGGAVVWINTLGASTPIHLPASDVATALPGSWAGLAGRAGTGTWAVIRRS